jgi:hypothetical protein
LAEWIFFDIKISPLGIINHLERSDVRDVSRLTLIFEVKIGGLQRIDNGGPTLTNKPEYLPRIHLGPFPLPVRTIIWNEQEGQTVKFGVKSWEIGWRVDIG